MMTKSTSCAIPADAELVTESLAGNRNAFGQIVKRYQSLICSLAYSATGDLNQSEDLAQEVFVTAWQQLASLREPEKLRAWLCRITRNLACNALRASGAEPSHRAGSLEEICESPAPEPLPVEEAISHEEQLILWRSLERIPQTYREPLILFYREHQSIETVAANLDLSEDAVKQRLSRGRKILQAEVLAFVAGALATTNPGQAFTLSVLAALPALAFSAKAAALGTAAKGGMAVKGATLGWFGWLLGPAIGFVAGILGWREGLKNARTRRERKLMIRNALIILMGAIIFTISLVSLGNFASGQLWKRHPILIAMAGLGMTLGWCGFVFIDIWQFNRAFKRIRDEERQLHPEAYRDEKPVMLQSCDEIWEYRSRTTLLGLPLVHCRFGNLPGQKAEPAIGWIAYGGKAYGILFAAGRVAVGGISVGGVCFGIFSCGGLGFGLLAFGGLGVGAVAMGGAAIGWIASGGIALGWHAALGGMALAREFALGGGALAQHINDAVARAFFTRYRWLNFMRSGGPSFLFWLLCFGPMFLQLLLWRWARRKVVKRVETGS